MSWKNLSLILLVVCTWQLWRDCSRTPAAAPESAVTVKCPESVHHTTSWDEPDHDSTDEAPAAVASAPGFSINGFKVPAWAMWLAPHPGEDLRAYRDRMMPLAKAAVAPHRARVARSRDDFAALVHLDTQQRAQLDTAAQETASAIEEKVMGSFLNGDFSPATFKPMTGVAMARDLLDAVDKGNQKFVGSLTSDQQAQLAQHPFDFADYLVFSTKWEDLLGATN